MYMLVLFKEEKARILQQIMGRSHSQILPVTQISSRSLEKDAQIYNNQKLNNIINKSRKQILNLLYNCKSQDNSNLNQFVTYAVAECSIEIKDFQRAEFWYSLTIQINPNFKPAYKRLMYAYENQNKYQHLMQIIGKFLQLQPLNEQILLKHAHLYQQSKKFPAARKVYLRLIQVDKKNGQYYLKFVQNCLKSGNLSKIDLFLTYIEKGLKLSKQLQDKYYYLKGYISYVQNDYNSAKQMLERSISKNPHNQQPYLQLFETYVKLNNKQQAINILNKYLEIHPEAGQIQDTLLRYLDTQQHSLQGCIRQMQAFDTAIIRCTKPPIKHFSSLIAVGLIRRLQNAKAIDYCQQWIKNSKFQFQNFQPYYLLAIIYVANEDWEKSLAYATKVRTIAPKPEEADLLLAEIYFKSGNLDICHEIVANLDYRARYRYFSTDNQILFLSLLIDTGQVLKCQEIYNEYLVAEKGTFGKAMKIQLCLVMHECYFALGKKVEAKDQYQEYWILYNAQFSSFRHYLPRQLVKMIEIQLRHHNLDKAYQLLKELKYEQFQASLKLFEEVKIRRQSAVKAQALIDRYESERKNQKPKSEKQ